MVHLSLCSVLCAITMPLVSYTYLEMVQVRINLNIPLLSDDTTFSHMFYPVTANTLILRPPSEHLPQGTHQLHGGGLPETSSDDRGLAAASLFPTPWPHGPPQRGLRRHQLPGQAGPEQVCSRVGGHAQQQPPQSGHVHSLHLPLHLVRCKHGPLPATNSARATLLPGDAHARRQHPVRNGSDLRQGNIQGFRGLHKGDMGGGGATGVLQGILGTAAAVHSAGTAVAGAVEAGVDPGEEKWQAGVEKGEHANFCLCASWCMFSFCIHII